MRESVMLKVNNMDLEKVVLFMPVNLVVPKIDCPCWALQLIVFNTYLFIIIIIIIIIIILLLILQEVARLLGKLRTESSKKSKKKKKKQEKMKGVVYLRKYATYWHETYVRV